MGELRNLCRVVVANFGSKRGNQHQRSVEEFGDPGPIRLDAVDAAHGKAQHSGCKEVNRAQHIGTDQRLEYVQLEMALQAPHRHCNVVAHHLRGDHRQHLALRRG